MPSEQLTKGQENVLEKQGYRIVGNHSAVKACQWTRNMLSRKGECYKYKFYGIRSHQCLQMTTSFFCASRCKFCWRGQKAPVSEKWYGPIDSPEHIIKHAIDAQIKLLQGHKGNPKADQKNVKEFTFFMIMLEVGMLGVFVSLDFFLFYIFWEAMLIPMYFII